DDLLNSLANAHKLDPVAPPIWREWNEIRGLMGISSPPAADPSLDKRPERIIPSGYLRKPITAFPAGITLWHITIPGSLAIPNPSAEDPQWKAYDRERRITFDAYQRKG